MATTRTPGITVLADGRRFIGKRYLGVRIGLRVAGITQEQAEERLQTEMARVQGDATRKAHARPIFTACAARYIEQSRGKRSIDVIKWHVGLLQSYWQRGCALSSILCTGRLGPCPRASQLNGLSQTSYSGTPAGAHAIAVPNDGLKIRRSTFGSPRRQRMDCFGGVLDLYIRISIMHP